MSDGIRQSMSSKFNEEFGIDLRIGNVPVVDLDSLVHQLNTLREDDDKFLIRGDIVTKSIYSQDDSIIDALAIQKRATEELYKICNDNEILKDSIRDLVAEIEQARLIIESVLEK